MALQSSVGVSIEPEPSRRQSQTPRGPLDLPRWTYWAAFASAHACIAGWKLGLPLALDVLVVILPTLLIALNILVSYTATGLGERIYTRLTGLRPEAIPVDVQSDDTSLANRPPLTLVDAGALMPDELFEAIDGPIARD
jgi:hypothetical protein